MTAIALWFVGLAVVVAVARSGIGRAAPAGTILLDLARKDGLR